MYAAIAILNRVSRDAPLSEYVRMRLREWTNEGRDLVEIAKLGGISKSGPSQVASGNLGVGGTAAPQYAKAFGMTELELRAAALEWWERAGKATAEASREATPLGEAIAFLVGLGQGTEEELRAIAYAFKHERFADRDAKWWQRTLLLELEHERDRRLLERAAKKDQRNAQAREARLVADKHKHMQWGRADLEKAKAATEEPAPVSRPATKVKKRAG